MFLLFVVANLLVDLQHSCYFHSVSVFHFVSSIFGDPIFGCLRILCSAIARSDLSHM